jgi:hypothetical protein
VLPSLLLAFSFAQGEDDMGTFKGVATI